MQDKDISEIRSKPREFIPHDSFSVGSELAEFKESAGTFIQSIHKMTTVHGLSIQEVRGNMAVRLVTRAVRILLAYKEDRSQQRKLNVSQQRRVIQMTEDVINGVRGAVQFQASTDGNAIVEMFSNEIFPVDEDQILQVNKSYKQGKK